jgi:hypothetical protein
MDKDFINEQQRVAYIDELLADVNNTPIYPASEVQISIIEQLCHDIKIDVRVNLVTITYQEAEEEIRQLNEMQLDPILAGRNYSQTDILNHLKKLG